MAIVHMTKASKTFPIGSHARTGNVRLAKHYTDEALLMDIGEA